MSWALTGRELNFGPDGVLDGEDVLPGFTLSLREFFASADLES